MVTLILALCIPVTAFVTGYFVLQGVKVGLDVHKPKIDVKEIATPAPKVEEQPKQQATINEIVNEWLNGAPESR